MLLYVILAVVFWFYPGASPSPLIRAFASQRAHFATRRVI